jgi:succinate dehydrogenase/fumarate reductase-like Fe-S protein
MLTLGSQANSSIVRAKMEETVIYKPTMKCQQMADDMSVFMPNAEKEILRIRAESTEHDLLLQGRPEAAKRAKAMMAKMEELGFGNCTNTRACEAVCPKNESIANIARLNREFLKAKLAD